MAKALPPNPVPSPSALIHTANRAKDRLIVQPRPDALAVVQVALFPLLIACGVDVYDADVMRGTVEARRITFKLQLQGSFVLIEVFGVGNALPRVSGEEVPSAGWTVRSNGGDWQLLLPGEKPYAWSLYDDLFPRVFDTLFQIDGPDLGHRAASARSILQQQWLSDKLARLASKLGPAELLALLRGPEGTPERVAALLNDHHLLRSTHAVDRDAMRLAVSSTLASADGSVAFNPADPIDITLAGVLQACAAVTPLRGQLRATFDGQELPITSRGALYFVLVSLAIQVGREDAIPASDLVRPPQQVPSTSPSRSLPRPGWYLMTGRTGPALQTAVSALLDRLKLRKRLVVTQRGRPWPD